MAEKENIEREALIQHMQECKGDSVFNIMATGYAYSFIENAPACDVVEVVRCKDCKFWGTPHNTCSVLGNLTTEGLVQTSPDWFCALAERKDKS